MGDLRGSAVMICGHTTAVQIKTNKFIKRKIFFHCETIVIGGFVLKEAFHANNQVKFGIFPDCLTPPLLPYFLENHNCR